VTNSKAQYAPCVLALQMDDSKDYLRQQHERSLHRWKPLADVFGAEMAGEVWDCFTIHYAPTHGSWLNRAEIEIGISRASAG
jgi:hypothetical protein